MHGGSKMADSIFDVMIPEEIKNCNLPSPEELEYWKLAKNRVFFIDYEIDEDYRLVELSKTIIRMNFEERDVPEEQLKPIYVFVMSYGGDIDQANYVCDLFETSRIPIVTVATGAAMSAGFLLFLSGKRRYAFLHSQLLVHQGCAAFQGTAEEVKEAQKNYQRQLDQMRDYIISHSDINLATFNKNRKRDWYLTAEEITKYNIAKIVKNFAEIE